MRNLLTIVLLSVILSGCMGPTCSEDLSKSLSSCPVKTNKPMGEWVVIKCGSSSVQVRADAINDKDYCYCLEGFNRLKRECK